MAALLQEQSLIRQSSDEGCAFYDIFSPDELESDPEIPAPVLFTPVYQPHLSPLAEPPYGKCQEIKSPFSDSTLDSGEAWDHSPPRLVVHGNKPKGQDGICDGWESANDLFEVDHFGVNEAGENKSDILFGFGARSVMEELDRNMDLIGVKLERLNRVKKKKFRKTPTRSWRYPSKWDDNSKKYWRQGVPKS